MPLPRIPSLADLLPFHDHIIAFYTSLSCDPTALPLSLADYVIASDFADEFPNAEVMEPMSLLFNLLGYRLMSSLN